ncbi:MAG TPA: copper chaperone PCu(A)C [Streptosporangiaceae bacterium]|nr:copper chaperone PCu(A)C [Streptosporangiaceae bacterium]
MLGTTALPARTASGRLAARRVARAAAGACLIALTAAGLTGCYASASTGTSIALATAYVPQPSVPGETVAYLVIRNNGGKDRLIGARTSVGGRVTFRNVAGRGSTAMRTIPAINIPADGTVRLVPDGLHLLITGAGPMHGGKDITLTLVFAHAGAVSVLAQVTNPQTGGSNYFLN